jgi:putative transposase
LPHEQEFGMDTTWTTRKITSRIPDFSSAQNLDFESNLELARHTLCIMFNRAIHAQALPKYLSSDHDPLYRFHQWQANLRVLMVQEIKTVPYVPLSHPFVERLIGTIRREYLDQTLFWTAADLEEKLRAFQNYFNKHRVHSGLKGQLPDPEDAGAPLNFASYRWQKHCRGLYQTPIAA